MIEYQEKNTVLAFFLCGCNQPNLSTENGNVNETIFIKVSKGKSRIIKFPVG